MIWIGFQHLLYLFITYLWHFCFFCRSSEFHVNLLIFLLAKSSVLSIDSSLSSFPLNSNFPYHRKKGSWEKTILFVFTLKCPAELRRNVWQTVRRVDFQILEVNELERLKFNTTFSTIAILSNMEIFSGPLISLIL